MYVDFKGDPLPNSATPSIVGKGSHARGHPGGARIRVSRIRYLLCWAIGIRKLTATTQATAVTNALASLCVPGSPCGLFPITVPYEVSTCDNNGTLHPGSGEWPFLGDDDTIPDNEAIVPLCKDKNDDIGGGSAGSVGWLDYSTAINGTHQWRLSEPVQERDHEPLHHVLPFSTWVKTFTGGVGKGGPAIQDALNAYHDDIVQIPLFDGTCKKKPTGTICRLRVGRYRHRDEHLVSHPFVRQLQVGLGIHQWQRSQAMRQAAWRSFRERQRR